MSYLIDTETIISGIKGREPSASFILDRVADGVSISVISYGEVLEGLLHPVHGSSFQRERFYEFVDSFDLLEIGFQEVRHYARVRSELRSYGLLIPDNDLWIAATALAHDLTLVTNDQHFSRIPDLKLYPFD